MSVIVVIVTIDANDALGEEQRDGAKLPLSLSLEIPLSKEDEIVTEISSHHGSILIF